MFQLSKNNETDFLGQKFPELFQIETRSHFLGHLVYKSLRMIMIWFLYSEYKRTWIFMEQEQIRIWKTGRKLCCAVFEK